jgi:hypothetical protein
MEKEAENLADIAEVLIINRVLCPNGDYKVRNLASFLQKILSLLATMLEKEREVEEAEEIDYNADGKLYR